MLACQPILTFVAGGRYGVCCVRFGHGFVGRRGGSGQLHLGMAWRGLVCVFLCLRRGDFMGHPSFLSPFGAPHWSSTMVLGNGQGSLKQNGAFMVGFMTGRPSTAWRARSSFLQLLAFTSVSIVRTHYKVEIIYGRRPV